MSGLESIAKDTEIIADAATNKIVEDHFSFLASLCHHCLVACASVL